VYEGTYCTAFTVHTCQYLTQLSDINQYVVLLWNLMLRTTQHLMESQLMYVRTCWICYAIAI